MQVQQLVKLHSMLGCFLGMDRTKPLGCESNMIKIALVFREVTLIDCNGWLSFWKGLCFLGRSRQVRGVPPMKVNHRRLDGVKVGEDAICDFFAQLDLNVVAGKRYRELHSCVVVPDRLLQMRVGVDAGKHCFVVQFRDVHARRVGDDAADPLIEYELPCKVGARNLLAVALSFDDEPSDVRVIMCDYNIYVREGRIYPHRYHRRVHEGCILGFRLMYKSLMQCLVCGERTKTCCSKCTDAFYCCRDHQVADWRSHKQFCHTVNTSASVGDDDADAEVEAEVEAEVDAGDDAVDDDTDDDVEDSS